MWAWWRRVDKLKCPARSKNVPLKAAALSWSKNGGGAIKPRASRASRSRSSSIFAFLQAKAGAK